MVGASDRGSQSPSLTARYEKRLEVAEAATAELSGRYWGNQQVQEQAVAPLTKPNNKSTPTIHTPTDPSAHLHNATQHNSQHKIHNTRTCTCTHTRDTHNVQHATHNTPRNTAHCSVAYPRQRLPRRRRRSCCANSWPRRRLPSPSQPDATSLMGWYFYCVPLTAHPREVLTGPHLNTYVHMCYFQKNLFWQF